VRNRPGRKERARVKKHHRGETWCGEWGAGTDFVKMGEKKYRRWLKVRFGRNARTVARRTERQRKCPDMAPTEGQPGSDRPMQY